MRVWNFTRFLKVVNLLPHTGSAQCFPLPLARGIATEIFINVHNLEIKLLAAEGIVTIDLEIEPPYSD